MIRYLILILVLSGALAGSEALATLPGVGYAAPAMGLLFVMVYAIRGSGAELLPLSFVAGILEGALKDVPGGFYILVYALLAWLVVRIRSLLFTEFALTQILLVFLAGCVLEIAFVAARGIGLVPAAGGLAELMRPLCSGASAALLAPLALKVYDRSSFLRELFRK